MKALNKITIFAAVVLMLLGTSQSAFADNGRDYRGYNGHEGKAHHNRQEDRQVTRRVISEPVVVDPGYSRRLIRDRSGNCFEKSYDRNGNQEVFEVSPTECAW